MKTLVLLRHAKSSWKHADLKDFDRPLKKRGKKDASRMGDVFNDIQLRPELILSSPANRAITTARIAAESLGYDVEKIVEVPALYLESEAKMREQIQAIQDDVDTAVLVGHNPALTDLANSLSGDSLENIPTAGAYAIQFDVASWREVGETKGTRAWFERPSEHRKKGRKKKQKQEQAET